MSEAAEQAWHSNTVWRRAAAVAILLGMFLAVLTFSLRGSFWDANDYGLLSLSHAIHFEWRLTHWDSIPSPGLAGHPGILFYFASWLALALTIPSFLPADFERFSKIMANAEAIYIANQAIAIVVVALSAGAFVRVASRITSFGVILAALGIWLGSSYQSFMTSTALSIETFALQLNVLLLWILLKFTRTARISNGDLIIGGLVAASGYLMKLPYLYVAFGVIAAFTASCVINRATLIRTLSGLAIIVSTFMLAVAGIGYGVIGKLGFEDLLRFHEAVLLHSGHYGNGDIGVLQASHAKAAFNSFLAYGSTAPWLALILGLLCIGLTITVAWTRKASPAELVLSAGAGVASVSAAAGVLKHFEEHYAAGVSATLPALVIAVFLLLKSIQPERFRRFGMFLAGVLLAGFLTYGIYNSLRVTVADKRLTASRRAEGLEDRRQMDVLLHAGEGKAFFGYRVPMREFGEGFVLHFTGIAALQDEYRSRNQSRVSSFMIPAGTFKYVVLDKNYFPNLSAIQNAKSLNPAGSAQVTLSSADQIVELRRCFVVVKAQPFVLPPP